jgi:hypothetical protein
MARRRTDGRSFKSRLGLMNLLPTDGMYGTVPVPVPGCYDDEECQNAGAKKEDGNFIGTSTNSQSRPTAFNTSTATMSLVKATPGHSAFIESAAERQKNLEESTRLFRLASRSDSESDNQAVNHGTILRHLLAPEIETLEIACRCSCDDWSKLRLLLQSDRLGFDQSALLKILISDNVFDGVVVLVLLDDDDVQDKDITNDSEWKKLKVGVHSNLLVADSILHPTSSRVYRNSLISKSNVGPHSVLVNCGTLSTSSNTNKPFGNIQVSVGAESGGGRSLILTPEHTMIDVCQQLQSGAPLVGAEQSTRLQLQLNILSRGTIVRDTPTIQNVYLAPNSTIQAATSVTNAILLPQSHIGNSCTALNVFLQWNAAISDHSTVSDTLLMEQAYSGPHSLVASSVLGPDVHVSAGEVHGSVIGPNTNSHHQSLVTGVLWPMGRGNVGYGANVGSNHTGRLPDQETAAGEGTFWGLGCVVKFPVDLTYAPYSIVAAGTTVAPQRVCMPFSLIVGLDSGNEIIPGWVLQSSPYTLARSETKFATRRKADRHDFYTGWKIFRPEVIDMCRWARAALQQGADDTSKTQGIGVNGLSKRGREVGMRSYNDCIQRFALQGLLTWLLKLKETGKGFIDEKSIQREFSSSNISRIPYVDPFEQVVWPRYPWETTESEWSYQRALLLEEFPMANIPTLTWVSQLLQKLIVLEADFAKRIFKSKKRDDVRGADTIPGYAAAHVAAEKDPVILEARTLVVETEKAVCDIADKLSSNIKSKL